MRWCRDPKSEQLLSSLGVQFEYREFRIADLRVAESRQNNARLGLPTAESAVESYTVAMANNAEFPAIICTPSGYILDGNHRTESAIRNDVDKVMAYVVLNADRAMMDQIVRRCNTTHGLPLSKDHKIIHAVHLHIEGEMSLSEAAKAMGLKYNDVKDAVEVTTMRAKLEDMGIQSSSLQKSIVLKLKPIAEQDDIFKQTASLVVNEKLTTNEVDSLMTQLTSVRTEGARSKILVTWRSRIVGRRDRGTQFPERAKLFRQLETLAGLVNDIQSLEAIGVRTNDDRRDLQHLWRQARSRLDELFNAARKVAK